MGDTQQNQQNQQQNEGGNDAGSGGNEPDEAAFWEKLKSEVSGIVDAALEKKKKEWTTTGTSRTGGRSTLPSALARFMGGPFSPQDK